MSYALIERLQKKAIPIQQSCRVLGVSRAGYYSARSRPAKPLLCKVGVHLTAAFITSGQSYGSRRLVSALAGQGMTIGRYKARSLMRRAGLRIARSGAIKLRLRRGNCCSCLGRRNGAARSRAT